MSSKVKERLKQMTLEMTHEERIELDNALGKLAMKMGLVISMEEGEEVGKPCDYVIESIPDDKLREIVRRIRKKKRRIEVPIEAEQTQP